MLENDYRLDALIVTIAVNTGFIMFLSACSCGNIESDPFKMIRKIPKLSKHFINAKVNISKILYQQYALYSMD